MLKSIISKLYTASIWSVKKLHFSALLEGICATLNLQIQPLKLYVDYCLDIHLKEIIMALPWEARK